MYSVQEKRIRSYYQNLLWGEQVNLFTALWVMELDVGFDANTLRELLLHRSSPMQLDRRDRNWRNNPPDHLMVVPQLMDLAQKHRQDGLFKLVPQSKGNYVAYQPTENGRTLFYKALESRIELAIQAPHADPAFICNAMNEKFLSEQRRKNTLFAGDRQSHHEQTPIGVRLLQTAWFTPSAIPTLGETHLSRDEPIAA